MTKKVLVFGGTKGFGFAIAQRFQRGGCEVHIVGRENPEVAGLNFIEMDLTDPTTLPAKAVELGEVHQEPWDTVVYAAGARLVKKPQDTTPKEITTQAYLSVVAPQLVMSAILRSQPRLNNLVVITSSSQFTARPMEVSYCAGKAALGMFAESMSLTGNISHVLHFAPGGMQTSFWDGSDQDVSTMLDPEWVVDTLFDELGKTGLYRYTRVNREKVIEVPKSR